MPTTDFTPFILDLEDSIIHSATQDTSSLHVFFSLKKKPHRCPHCGALTQQIHDYRTTLLKDIPVMGKSTFLHYKKRRYRCSCGKRFYESFPHQAKYCRTTLASPFMPYTFLETHKTFNL